jgi:hypothetical protein
MGPLSSREKIGEAKRRVTWRGNIYVHIDARGMFISHFVKCDVQLFCVRIIAGYK